MSGLLGDLFKNLQAMGVRATPTMTQNEIVLTITEEEFKNMALKGVDDRAKQNISIKFEEGKMIIRVRLF